MSNKNNKSQEEKEIFAVYLLDKNIRVKINTTNLPTLLTALKMLELQVEDMIIANQQKTPAKETKIVSPDVVVPPNIIDRLRGK